MRRATLAWVGISTFLMFTACGRSNLAQPTANSGASAMPAGNRRSSLNTAVQGVPGSRVDIVQGLGAGTSVVSNGNGVFALPAGLPKAHR